MTAEPIDPELIFAKGQKIKYKFWLLVTTMELLLQIVSQYFLRFQL